MLLLWVEDTEILSPCPMTTLDSNHATHKSKIRPNQKTVQFALMDAPNLALTDNTFDTIVATFVFCSVSDPVKGLKEEFEEKKRDLGLG
jgi:ubiquinone/menaquinone biosynthesis C-methylase UbiE